MTGTYKCDLLVRGKQKLMTCSSSLGEKARTPRTDNLFIDAMVVCRDVDDARRSLWSTSCVLFHSRDIVSETDEDSVKVWAGREARQTTQSQARSASAGRPTRREPSEAKQPMASNMAQTRV